jgi:hypothetical protein
VIMGGLGSGRRSRKRTVAECFSIDINQLLRAGLFSKQRGRLCWQDELALGFAVREEEDGTKQLVLSHSVDRPAQTVPLTTTMLVSGGSRWWFVCPRCDRRAAKLYLPPSEQAFGCRVCYDLAYPTSQANRERCFRANK